MREASNIRQGCYDEYVSNVCLMRKTSRKANKHKYHTHTHAQTHIHTHTPKLLHRGPISSKQRRHSSWKISTWQKAQFGWPSENLKTDGKPQQHLAGNLEVCQDGIYIWAVSVPDTVLQLSRCERWFLDFQMPDVPCGLPSLTHTVWHMTHWNLFSLRHATPYVLMNNKKKALKQSFTVEHAVGNEKLSTLERFRWFCWNHVSKSLQDKMYLFFFKTFLEV